MQETSNARMNRPYNQQICLQKIFYQTPNRLAEVERESLSHLGE